MVVGVRSAWCNPWPTHLVCLGLSLLLLDTMMVRAEDESGGRVGGRDLLPSHDGCVTLDPLLLAATTDTLATLTTTTHLYLVFQNDPEGCLVRTVWESGVAAAAVGEAAWWRRLWRLSYLEPSQHLLIGDHTWITSIMSRVKSLYISGRISAWKTRWIWVSTNLDLDQVNSSTNTFAQSPLFPSFANNTIHAFFPSTANTPAPTATTYVNTTRALLPTNTHQTHPTNSQTRPTNTQTRSISQSYTSTRSLSPTYTLTRSLSPTFTRTSLPTADDINNEALSAVLDTLSSALQEGTRGVFLAVVRRGGGHQLEKDDSFRSRRVAVGGMAAVVAAAGSGSWRLIQVAEWRRQVGLRVFKSLWPSPSFNLHQRVVRLACTRKPTVMEFPEGARELREVRGYAADLLRLLQPRLNFSSTLVKVKGFGSLTSNGTWNGMVGALARQEADVAPLDFSPGAARARVIDFGICYSVDSVTILSRSPFLLPRPFLLLNIFSPLVWACILGVVACAGVGEVVLVVAEGHLLGENTEEPQRYVFSIFKIFVYQSSIRWPEGSGGRVVGGVAMLTALVLGSLYSGYVTAFLAIPFKSDPVNSAEDLAATDIVPVFRARTATYNFFINQKGGVLGQLRAKMETVEPPTLKTWTFLSKIANGTYALLVVTRRVRTRVGLGIMEIATTCVVAGMTALLATLEETIAKYCHNLGQSHDDTESSAMGLVRKFERRGSQCKFHRAKQIVKLDLDSFAFARNSFLLQQFDEIMRRLRYGGLIQQLKRRYYQMPCEVEVARSGPDALTLLQVQAAFYVLAVGLEASIMVLVLELVGHTWWGRLSSLLTHH